MPNEACKASHRWATTPDEEAKPADAEDGDAPEHHRRVQRRRTVAHRPISLRDGRLDRVPPRPRLVAAPAEAQPATERGAVHEGPFAPHDPLSVHPWRRQRASDEPHCAERDSKRQERRKHEGGKWPHWVECDTRKRGCQGESDTGSRVAWLHFGLGARPAARRGMSA